MKNFYFTFGSGPNAYRYVRIPAEDWNSARDKMFAFYGKHWACDEFGRDKPYASFDRGGWHIVLLDSVFPFGEGYIGRLDDAQWDWLERDLAAVGPETPVILLSHIPILSATPLAVAGPMAPQAGGIQVPIWLTGVDNDDDAQTKTCVKAAYEVIDSHFGYLRGAR